MARIFQLILIILLYSNIICIAQIKIIDKSESKTPKWINEFSKDFIICSGIGSTIDEAKDKALIQVKQEIANSVAVNIQSTSILSQKEERVNNNGGISESLQTEIKSKTANIPALKGISLSKAANVYWQKEKVNTTIIQYRLYIKYPFADADLFALLQEYNEMELKMDSLLDELSEYSTTIASTDDIDNLISKVDELILYFTDLRKNKAVSKKTELLNLYSKIDLRINSNEKNKLDLSLYLFDKQISTSVKPVFRSNCCSEFSYINNILTYNSENCYSQDQNYIEIFYPFTGYRLYKKIIVKI